MGKHPAACCRCFDLLITPRSRILAPGHVIMGILTTVPVFTGISVEHTPWFSDRASTGPLCTSHTALKLSRRIGRMVTIVAVVLFLGG